MLKPISDRLTFANVVSVMALFVALGGTAVAAGVAANSVGTRQLKDQSVTTSKIKDKAVTGAKVNVSTLGIVPRANTANKLSPALKASLTLHCPQGLQRAADTCFEPALRPAATFPDALGTCAVAQRRLPSASELALVFDHLGAPQENEWIATPYVAEISGVLQHLGTLLAEDTSRKIRAFADVSPNSWSYRCVTSPTN
ncbi:MAG: hypothetical protein ACR2OB_13315 [Solirubrobacteraceae bacterium]